MKIPVIHGRIDRRILANYRVDPLTLAHILPPPFRPKIMGGFGIAGICLIRLRHLKPQFMSGEFGFLSENAAHRIAVEWTDERGVVREGVYIQRRDTTSRLNTFLGGRVFPGLHNHARFDVSEHDDRFHVAFASDDGHTRVLIEGSVARQLPASSVFQTLREASTFFEAGSLGYSATRRPGQYDGLELRSLNWSVEPLAVDKIESSFFADRRLFPSGSLEFDCALIMRGIEHEWHGREQLCCPVPA